MTKTGKVVLLGAAFGGFVVHCVASLRWLVIDLTRGNRTGIPIDSREAMVFLLAIAILASTPWMSRTIRTGEAKMLGVATAMNATVFAFTGALLWTGVIYVLK